MESSYFPDISLNELLTEKLQFLKGFEKLYFSVFLMKRKTNSNMPILIAKPWEVKNDLAFKDLNKINLYFYIR